MTNFTTLAPETEALVVLDEWGGVEVPCDIVEVYNNGKAIKDTDEIVSTSTAKVAVWVGTSQELTTGPVQFTFVKPITALSN